MKKPKLIFTKEASTFILEALGFSVNAQGLIINNKTKMKVKDAIYGENVHIDEFAGISKEGIFKGDLGSIMHLALKTK